MKGYRSDIFDDFLNDDTPIRHLEGEFFNLTKGFKGCTEVDLRDISEWFKKLMKRIHPDEVFLHEDRPSIEIAIEAFQHLDRHIRISYDHCEHFRKPKCIYDEEPLYQYYIVAQYYDNVSFGDITVMLPKWAWPTKYKNRI